MFVFKHIPALTLSIPLWSFVFIDILALFPHFRVSVALAPPYLDPTASLVLECATKSGASWSLKRGRKLPRFKALCAGGPESAGRSERQYGSMAFPARP